MHKFILMFAILATLSMSSLAHAQRGGQRGEGGPRGGQRGGQRPASPMMTALDANKDGKLSAEEIANAATALKTLDKNKDGVIDANELAPPRGPGGPGGQGGAQGGRSSQMVERIMARDTDGDGKVSREEAGESRFFDRMDADSDGFVTKAEIENMAQQFGGGRRGGGGRGAGGGGGRGGAGGGGRGAGPSTKENRPGFDE